MVARRHPNKGKRWIKDKYFRREGNRKWVFTSLEKEKGRVVVHKLLRSRTHKDRPLRANQGRSKSVRSQLGTVL